MKVRWTVLSSYRIMWLMCMFDLPVVEPEERKRAQRFRNLLLDQGFEMAQYSVYMRFCSSENVVDTYRTRIRKQLPEEGHVKFLAFTDRQYSRMETFWGGTKKTMRSAPETLEFW